MGCFYEINDTLLLTKDEGFPSDILNIERHQKNPVTLKDVDGKGVHPVVDDREKEGIAADGPRRSD